MGLFFVTGNQGKFEEVSSLMPGIKMLDIDLPEIQSLDSQEIIAYKLNKALEHTSGACLVEDVSLSVEGMNGLPGPLVKWFLETVGPEGLSELAIQSGNPRATASVTVGYAKTTKDPHFFVGAIDGRIVAPRGDQGFGWDAVFQPDGFEKTFAEMSPEEKNQCSMRSIAYARLQEFLSV